MRFIKIDNISSRHFEECWRIYCDSFPFCERRDIDAQECVLSDQTYSFEAIISDVDGAVVGLIGYWIFGSKRPLQGDEILKITQMSLQSHTNSMLLPEPSAPSSKFHPPINDLPSGAKLAFCNGLSKWLFLEHIAISKLFRGGGVGSQVMEYLKSLGYPIILEIEPVVDSATERRLRFYSHLGFEVNCHKHKQPPFRIGEEWLPLVVLSYPRTLSNEEYNLFRLSQIAIV